jgi:hypothetical protein
MRRFDSGDSAKPAPAGGWTQPPTGKKSENKPEVLCHKHFSS